MTRLLAASVLLSLALASGAAQSGDSPTLIGFASLPADTFAPGPTSGQLITPANGRTPPFLDKQPAQGFSSVLRASHDEFLVMCDNGFGQKGNSPDYVLRVYRISPEFRTRRDRHGSSSRHDRDDDDDDNDDDDEDEEGTIEVESFFTLRDPNRKVNFQIVADLPFYPGSTIPVDDEIRSRRLLTGGDFDIESFREAHDGTFWFGDEFGPFLLHTDRQGRVLEPPAPLPGVKSPQNPFLAAGEVANLPRSKGFEGMAVTKDGKTLYPMLEGSLTTDPNQRRLIISEFDIKTRRYTGQRWFYRLEADSATQAIGDLTTVGRRSFLVIERDNFEGAAAVFKKIYLVNFDEVDADGFLGKREIVDLMNIADPHNLGGHGPVFTFPFQTIESVIPLSETVLGVLNDNNYPFSAGRVPGDADPNEFVLIKLDRPLRAGRD